MQYLRQQQLHNDMELIEGTNISENVSIYRQHCLIVHVNINVAPIYIYGLSQSGVFPVQLHMHRIFPCPSPILCSHITYYSIF